MKKIFIAILFVCFVNTLKLSAQNMLVEYLHKTEMSDLLEYVSITDSASYLTHKVAAIKGGVVSGENDPDKFYRYLFVKNIAKNKIYFVGRTHFGKSVDVEDTLHNMKWQFTSDKKTILDFPCKSAKTNFRGRNYTAYYTEKIPISNGPWKFGGLPGLILEISSEDGEFSWIVQNIHFNPDVTKMHIQKVNFAKFKFFTWQKYVEFYKEVIDKYVAKLKADYADKPGPHGSLKVSDIEIIYPALNLGKGIEW
jgi:GLPGLI family protein